MWQKQSRISMFDRRDSFNDWIHSIQPPYTVLCFENYHPPEYLTSFNIHQMVFQEVYIKYDTHTLFMKNPHN